jgi:hypothetical protein
MDEQHSDLDELQPAYKAAVEEWISAIRKEEALAFVNHSVAEVDSWENAGFENTKMRRLLRIPRHFQSKSLVWGLAAPKRYPQTGFDRTQRGGRPEAPACVSISRLSDANARRSDSPTGGDDQSTCRTDLPRTRNIRKSEAIKALIPSAKASPSSATA